MTENLLNLLRENFTLTEFFSFLTLIQH
jgi:hypothetical protein